jgi:hypothetical protein
LVKLKMLVIGVFMGVIFMSASMSFASSAIQAFSTKVHFMINGVENTMPEEYETLNYKDHIYVPIRFVTESLGGVIHYEGSSKTIEISNNVIVDPEYEQIQFYNISTAPKFAGYQVRGSINLIDVNTDNSMKVNNLGLYYKLTFLDGNEIVGEVSDLLEIEKNPYGKKNDFEYFTSDHIPAYSLVKLQIDYFDTYPITGQLPPMTQLTVSGIELPTTLSNFCWNDSGCPDYPPLLDVLKKIIPTIVEAGSTININIPYDPKPSLVTLIDLVSGYEVLLENNTFDLPTEKGDYYYSVKAEWHISDRQIAYSEYGFVVRLK